MKEFVRVIIKKDNKYLLIKEVKGTWYNAWNFPGGKIEPGETSEIAALRELNEEMNLKNTKLHLLYEVDCLFDNEPWYGFYFICSDFDLENLKVMETTKCDGYCFFPFEELKQLKLGIPRDVISVLEEYDNAAKSV